MGPRARIDGEGTAEHLLRVVVVIAVIKNAPQVLARRIFYYGYHNDDPQQMFRSSLPIDRVLEAPVDCSR